MLGEEYVILLFQKEYAGLRVKLHVINEVICYGNTNMVIFADKQGCMLFAKLVAIVQLVKNSN